jgi:hypothetical protein
MWVDLSPDCFNPGGKDPGIHAIRGWVALRNSLEEVKRRNLNGLRIMIC